MAIANRNRLRKLSIHSHVTIAFTEGLPQTAVRNLRWGRNLSADNTDNNTLRIAPIDSLR